jgi:hypothetical protein
MKIVCIQERGSDDTGIRTQRTLPSPRPYPLRKDNRIIRK